MWLQRPAVYYLEAGIGGVVVVTEEKEKAAVWGPHGWRAPEGAATVLVGTNAPPDPGWRRMPCLCLSAVLPSFGGDNWWPTCIVVQERGA